MVPFLSICEPLFKYLDIKYFRYVRFYPNGKYLTLCNSLPYTKYYLENIKELGNIIRPHVESAFDEKYTFLLWPDQLNNRVIKQDSVFSALHAHNIWNGTSVFRKHKDYVESWNFAGNPENTGLKNLFVNNQKSIENFIALFQSKAKDLINTHDLKNMASYKDRLIILNQRKNEILFKIKTFNEIIHQQRSWCSKIRQDEVCNNSFSTITNRELECLASLANGQTAKMSARILNISPRTVERHLENIKMKLGARYKIELVHKYVEWRKGLVPEV